MTIRREMPSSIGMKLVLVLLLASGCSWLTARAPNDPKVSCTRTPGRIDAGLAVIGVAGLVTSIVMFGEPPEEAHTRGNPLFVATATPALLLALVETLQAGYGLGVADRCEAERARMLARPDIAER
jgi:hypothetical protein